MRHNLTAWEAAQAVGEKVIEVADRVLPMHKIAPGTIGKTRFEMDDVWYEVTIRVVESSDG